MEVVDDLVTLRPENNDISDEEKILAMVTLMMIWLEIIILMIVNGP